MICFQKLGMMSNYYIDDEDQKAFEQNILSKITEIKEFKQMILNLIKLRNKIYNYDLKRQKKVNFIKEEEYSTRNCKNSTKNITMT